MLFSVEQNLSHTPLRCWNLLSAPISTRTYPNQGAFTHCCAPSVSIIPKMSQDRYADGNELRMYQPPFRPVPPKDPWSPCPRQNAAVFSPFSFTRKYAPRGQSILPLAPPHTTNNKTCREQTTHTRVGNRFRSVPPLHVTIRGYGSALLDPTRSTRAPSDPKSCDAVVSNQPGSFRGR